MTTKTEKDGKPDQPKVRDLVRVATKLALKIVASAGLFVAAEAAQIMVMVAFVGLVVPLPFPVWRGGLGAYGIAVAVRYLTGIVRSGLKGTSTTALSSTKSALATAAKARARSSQSSPAMGDPEFMAALARLSQQLQAAKPAPKVEPKADEGRSAGPYL